MKKVFAFLLFFAAFGAVKAQTAAPANDVLKVKEDEFDFGTIPQGKPVFHFFQITNNGLVPLKLDNVQATCGCTTPEWNKEAIAAGANDNIKVGYNAAAEGPFTKIITVTYNGTATKQIKIKGTVWKAPAGSAPANTAVTFLKQQMQ